MSLGMGTEVTVEVVMEEVVMAVEVVAEEETVEAAEEGVEEVNMVWVNGLVWCVGRRLVIQFCYKTSL